MNIYINEPPKETDRQTARSPIDRPPNTHLKNPHKSQTYNLPIIIYFLFRHTYEDK